MSGAQFEHDLAPYERARRLGFLFKTDALLEGGRALDEAWRANRFPLVLNGPRGLGKKTLVTAWLRTQSRDTITAARIAADELQQGSVAEALLAAFGHKPSADASPSEALCDFLEDCVFEGRPGFVMVSDAQAIAPGVWDELLQLAAPLAEGGIGLPLCATSSRGMPDAAKVSLPLMDEEASLRFCHAVLDMLGDARPEISDDQLLHLAQRAGGVPGRLGPLIDDMLSHQEGGEAPAYEPVRDEPPRPRASAPKAPEPAPRQEARSERKPEPVVEAEAPSAVPKAPATSAPEPDDLTPEAIEEAILRLAAGEISDAVPARRKSASFPKIATGGMKVASAPANDPAEVIAPRVAKGLEAVAREVAELQGHLVIVRDQAEALRRRLDARKDHRTKAAERFVGELDGALRMCAEGGGDSR